MPHEPIWPAGSVGPSGPESEESKLLHWKNQGACRGRTSLFFAEGRGNLGEIQTAKAICNNECPVLMKCRAYALEMREQYGVWGGMSPNQRTRYWSKQRHAEEVAEGVQRSA